MNLEKLLVVSDLKGLDKNDLKSILTDLEMDTSNMDKAEMVREIGNKLLKRNTDVYSELKKYLNKLFINGSVSWYKTSKGSLIKLRTIIEKLKDNPFKNVKKLNANNITSEPTIFGAADFNFIDNDNSYILRFAYKSSNYPDFNGINFINVPKIKFANVVIIPNSGIVEIRASSRIRKTIADKIGSLFNDESIALSPLSIFSDDFQDNGFDDKMNRFKSSTNSKLNESVDINSIEFPEELTNSDLDDVYNVLHSIDNKMLGEDDVDINKVIEDSDLISKFPYATFSTILLSGISKIDLKSSRLDLENSPLYSIFRGLVDTKVSSVKVPVIENSVEEYYTVEIGRATNTVVFTIKSTEKLANIIREHLVLNN